MLVMVTATYPTSSYPKVVEVMMETMKEKIPDYIKVEGFYGGTGGEGIESHSIYNIEDDRFAEGMRLLERWIIGYFLVDGYKVKSEIISDLKGSLALIGK